MSEPTPTLPPGDDLPSDVPTLQRMVRELQAVVAAMQEQLRELTERQNRNSSNSSRPPSSDPPWRQRPQKPPSGKKRAAGSPATRASFGAWSPRAR